MFVCDSITAILLFAQFSILRSRAILVIASGYLFTALILVPYVLTFPGVFVATPEIGGLQSAAWVYVLWHCGFPLFVISYAIAKERSPSKQFSKSSPHVAIARSVALTAALVSVVALVCTAGEALLPHIMRPPVFSDWLPCRGAHCMASICAFVVLWFRRRSMLRSLVDGRDVPV
jgi:hypothetical protein